MDDSMVITLFRHGMTEANKRKAYLGWGDSPLCAEEIEKLRNYQLKQTVLFSSDLGRCVTTSALIFPTQIPELISELREISFGEWEGKTYADLADNLAYQKWLNDYYHEKPPQGELFSEFVQRVEMGWQKVRKRLMGGNERQAAIVTHGGVIQYLLSTYAPVKKGFWDWVVPHGRGFELIWKNDSWRRGERCTLLREVPLMERPNG